jgi:hypothetical protein
MKGSRSLLILWLLATAVWLGWVLHTRNACPAASETWLCSGPITNFKVACFVDATTYRFDAKPKLVNDLVAGFAADVDEQNAPSLPKRVRRAIEVVDALRLGYASPSTSTRGA